MSKNHDKERLARINAAYDAVFNDVGEMPIENVRRALAEVGAEPDELRASLHGMVGELARSLRASGQSAPDYLRRIIEDSSDAASLPHEPNRALDKAKQYLEGLLSVAFPSSCFELVSAFRGDQELSDRDRETIDALEAELLRRAELESENG